MAGIDWVIIGLYFAMLLGVAWWVARRNRDTADDYFLAGRNLGWFLVGASIFASNIGSEHVVGLAGAGATSGVALAHYELHAWCLLVLGWGFVPFYARALVYTMPEFLGRRFSPTARWVLSVITLAAHVLTKFAVAIFAGGVVFATLLPDVAVRVGGATFNSFWIGTVAVVLLTGLYTVLGGMRAVAYTDALQTFIVLWYWCTDQYIVQRALSAKNERTARRGSIFAAYLKLFPVFIFIIPGLIALALAKTGRVPGLGVIVDAQGHPIPQAAQAVFPLMVRDLLPAGVRGVVVAGLLAALMSSMAGAFNASSTLFTMDLYQKFRPNAPQHRLVWVGRAATAAMVVISLLWIPVIQGARGLYDYLQGVQGYLAPPIFTVFVFGIFNRRLNSKGCLAALLVGFVLGVFRLAVDTPVSLHLPGFADGYNPGSFLWIVNNLYFQYYSLFIFIVSVIVMVVVSYATAPPRPEQFVGLTYGTVTVEDRASSRASWSAREVIASAVVLVLILAAYLYFRG